jgi:hypothetical protein
VEYFDPKKLDIRWYSTPKEDRLDLLYDLLKQAFRKMMEIEDDMKEKQNEILSSIQALQSSQDENFKTIKDAIPILKWIQIRTRRDRKILLNINTGFDTTGYNVEQSLESLNTLEQELEDIDLTVLNTEEKVESLHNKVNVVIQNTDPTE